MDNIFQPEVTEAIISRIEKLTPDAQPQWGKMNVAQMLAHCNVTYELVYDDKHPQPNGLMKWMLKTFVKNTVVNDTPYKHNSRTAPVFLIADARDFAKEKARLIEHIRHTQQLGQAHFEGKESHSFGKLKSGEWNNMFFKHLDHHLRQFAV